MTPLECEDHDCIEIECAVPVSSDEPEAFPKSRIKYRSEGLSIAKPDAFSYDSVSFEEMAASMLDDVFRLYSFAVIKNRCSESYLALSRRLEKAVSEFASCCITKEVLEKKGAGSENLKICDWITSTRCFLSISERPTQPFREPPIITSNSGFRCWIWNSAGTGLQNEYK